MNEHISAAALIFVATLVTNAMKHAFPHGRAGRIRAAFEAVKAELRLSVEDDGVGFSPAYKKVPEWEVIWYPD